MRYNSYNDDILYMIERVSRTGSGDYLSPSIFSVRYNTYDEETNPKIVSNMAKSNRMPYSTKGYYPSYDFGLIKQGRLTSNIKEIYTKKQKEEIDNGLLKVTESIDLEVLRNTLKNISYLTDVDFWEIKVKENDVVLISDKYHKDKLIYVFGDKHIIDYETRGEKVKFPISDEDVTVFEDYRYRIPKVFEVDTTEDDYVQEVYVD